MWNAVYDKFLIFFFFVPSCKFGKCCILSDFFFGEKKVPRFASGCWLLLLVHQLKTTTHFGLCNRKDVGVFFLHIGQEVRFDHQWLLQMHVGTHCNARCKLKMHVNTRYEQPLNVIQLFKFGNLHAKEESRGGFRNTVIWQKYW